MISSREESYFKSLELKEKGFSYGQISSETSIPASTIKDWCRKGAKPLSLSKRHKVRIFNQTKHLPNNAKQTSKELGFILGALYGDGCFQKYTIELVTKDLDFATFFKDTIEKWSSLKATLKFRKNLWRVRLHSIETVNFLKEFDYKKLINCPEEARCGFIGGFFDSEGTISSKKYMIRVFNTDFNLLLFVKNLLESVEISTSKIATYRNLNSKGKKPLHSFAIYRKINFKKFYEKIGFSIKRKEDRLKKILEPNSHELLVDKILHFHSIGLLDVQISKKLNCHHHTVSNVRKKLNLDSNYSKEHISNIAKQRKRDSFGRFI